MSSNAVLDIEKLLAPLDGATPSGTNLRSGAGRDLYDQIRGARNQARTREKPQMMGDPTAVGGVPEEWSTVAEKSIEAIGSRSKDLELATYLIEALVRLYGFGGLRDGFRLYRELVERFWDTAYPPDDGDGPAGRVAAMGGLNGDATRDGALLFPINRVALTDGKDGAYAAFQYEYAVALDQLPTDRQQQRIDSGHTSLKTFATAANSTSAEFARTLSADLNEGILEFDKLAELLEAKCGADAPPSSKIRDALRKCLTIVESVYKDRLIEKTVDQPEKGDAAVTGGSGSTSVVVATGAIRNRDDAFRTIEQVTRFFRETEPQSPVIYALEQVVRWGRMPLPDLLSELITDDSTRTRLFEMIGIRPKDRSNGE